MMKIDEHEPPRPIIVWSLIVLVALSIFPWFSGGQDSLIRFITAGLILLGSILAWVQPSLRKLQYGPLSLSYFCFVGWTALSMVWSINRYETVIWLSQLILAGVVFRLAYAVSGELKNRVRLEYAYLISVAAFVVYAIYLFLTGEYNRLTGWFYWANPAAAYILPAIILLWGKLKLPGGKKPTKVGFIRRYRTTFVFSAACLFVSAFFLTDSRGVLLILALLIIPIMLIQSHNKYSRTLLVFTLIVGYVLALLLVQFRTFTVADTTSVKPGSRFAEAAAGESRSGQDRLNYLKSAADIWFLHPIIGTGGGTYASIHPQYQRSVVSASTSVHNIYAQTFAETGIIGGLLLAWFILLLIFGYFRGLWRDPTRTSAVIGGVVLILHFGLDIGARYPALLLLLAALSGIGYVSRHESHSKLSICTPIFAIFAFIVAMGSFQSAVAYEKGQRAQSEGDFPLASAWFAQAHSGLTYNPDTINAEGIDYYTEAIFGEPGADVLALDRARLAQRLDPEDSQHYQLEGRVLSIQKNHLGAERAFRLALKKDPYNHPDYTNDLALSLLAQNKPDVAEAEVRKMLEKYPDDVVDNRNADSSLRNHLANLYGLNAQFLIQKGKIEEAKKSLAQGLKLNPANLRCKALSNTLSGA